MFPQFLLAGCSYRTLSFTLHSQEEEDKDNDEEEKDNEKEEEEDDNNNKAAPMGHYHSHWHQTWDNNMLTKYSEKNSWTSSTLYQA